MFSKDLSHVKTLMYDGDKLQVCQVSAQQPVQTELLMRYHQLQSRLATLKIENEEVRIITVTTFNILSWTLSCYSASDVTPTRPFTDCVMHIAY